MARVYGEYCPNCNSEELYCDEDTLNPLVCIDCGWDNEEVNFMKHYIENFVTKEQLSENFSPTATVVHMFVTDKGAIEVTWDDCNKEITIRAVGALTVIPNARNSIGVKIS